ncbi:MAG: carboxypeptidase regulatory-like domain-containing protein [Chitinophagaceae bacterium]|nr:carboxypeptidase regulatory-like domain-containing protein [Chitinophagaceae bacterium]
MLKLLITSLLFIAAIPAQSQIGKITGSVNNHKEMSGAIVSLLRGKDTSLLKTSFIEDDGSFNFEKLAEGNYFIKITHTSFETYFSDLIKITNQQPTITLPSYSLKPAVKELQEVNVTGKKSFVERKIDRVVINPDLLISNAGATSLEVLEKHRALWWILMVTYH